MKKTAIVTGARRGIGLAIAKKLLEGGYRVVLCATTAAGEVTALLEELTRLGEAYYLRCDISRPKDRDNLLDQVLERFGRLDVLVNNAGVAPLKRRDILDMEEESFDRVLDVDLKGAFNCIRHCAGMFLRQKHGAIVNVSSVSGMIGNPGQANYSAAKAGLIGLTKAVAKELAPKGITCNAVAPGFIETDMTRDLSGQDNGLLAAIPLGRMGQPQEVAEAVAFLATAPYITGEVLRVDGGIAM